MFEYATGRSTFSAERATLLWCIRIWGMGSRRPAGAAWSVGEILLELGAPGAAAPFDDFMHHVSETATRHLEISCVIGRHITSDETALLDILALAQEARGFEVLLLLRECLNPRGAVEASECARVFAQAFTAAGLFLDAPDTSLRRFALPVPSDEIRPTMPLFGVSSW